MIVTYDVLHWKIARCTLFRVDFKRQCNKYAEKSDLVIGLKY